MIYIASIYLFIYLSKFIANDIYYCMKKNGIACFLNMIVDE